MKLRSKIAVGILSLCWTYGLTSAFIRINDISFTTGAAGLITISILCVGYIIRNKEDDDESE